MSDREMVRNQGATSLQESEPHGRVETIHRELPGERTGTLIPTAGGEVS